MNERSLEHQPIEQSRGAEIKAAQEVVTAELKARFEPYRNLPYSIYNDEKGSARNADEIEGFPKYYAFLKEVDYLAQYALSNEAEMIIVWDTSARGYGLLLKKVLPIIGLEKAVREGKNPADIKIPEIIFYKRYTYNREKLAKYIQSSGVTKVVMFDEASEDPPVKRTFVQSDGAEPFRWKVAEMEKDMILSGKVDENIQGRTSQTAPNTQNSSVQLEARILRKYFFQDGSVKIMDYLGGHGAKGGFDRNFRKDEDLSFKLPYGVQINEKAANGGEVFKEAKEAGLNYDQARDKFPLHAERADKENDIKFLMAELKLTREEAEIKLAYIKQQTRDEHSRMAWELFQQVILHEDPYHKK